MANAPNLASLQAAASRISARLSENLSEGVRDLGVNGLEGLTGQSGPRLLDSVLTGEDGNKETRRLLASTRDRDREEGLKRVIAIMLKGRPVVQYFPAVTNCLSSSALPVRALVALYISRQATLEPDLALLSVNTFQKDLADPNPALRALAMRALAGLDLEAIAGLVALSLKRAARDGSWYVRKTAAAACARLSASELDRETHFTPIVALLLADRSPLVVGSAAAAFQDVCPTRVDLLHPVYRSLCRSLVDADEWGQIALLDVLMPYARSNFLNPDKAPVDNDLELLLRCTEPLLASRNPAVVLAATRCLIHIGPASTRIKTIRPLLRLLNGSNEMQQVVLAVLSVIAAQSPNLLAAHLPEFYLRGSDSLAVRRQKLRCLVALVNEENVKVLLRELLEYVREPDEIFAAEAIKAIGRCATTVPSVTDECIQALLGLVRSSSDLTVAQSIAAIRSLLANAPQSRSKVMACLVRLLHQGKLSAPAARIHTLWLVAQYADQSIAPDALRIAVRAFVNETSSVKLQTLDFSLKLAESQPQLFQHVMLLARYDLDPQVRDRARFLGGLSTLPQSQAIMSEKPTIVEADRTGELAQIGSLELLLEGKKIAGSRQLPAWATTRSDPASRAEAAAPAPASAPRSVSSRLAPSPVASGRASPVVLTPVQGSSPARQPVYRDLDDFLASEGETESEEESSDTASEEEESSDHDDERQVLARQA